MLSSPRLGLTGHHCTVTAAGTSLSRCVAGVRDMLLSELKALFSADCDALIDFHGAMYR